MLIDFIQNLRLAFVVIVFIGFIAFAVLMIAAEHRYYVLHFEGKYKYSKLLYWFVALMTVAALLYIYRLFFLGFYVDTPTPNPTAYV